jgi:ribosome-binding factor A
MTKRQGSARDFPRTARLNHLVHEIVAEEIELLDDERLGFLTVVGVEVESDLRRATVYYTTLEDADPDIAELLEEHRGRLQAAIARQARLKRTPELVFRPDSVIVQAQRVEDILRDLDNGPGPDGG